MHFYLTALAVIAGICFAFGILFLFLGLRRKDDREPTLLFSLFALSYAATVMTGIGNYSASSIAEWMSSARWDGVFVVLTWCSLIWYVAAYTRVRPHLFLWLLTAVFASAGVAHVSRPTLIHETIFDLAYVTLPWGEQLAYAESTDSVWATVFLVANLVTIGYALVACTLHFRRGERRSALVLGTGMAWFIFTVLVDILVDLGLAPLYVGDFGFLGLAIVLSLQLANEVIRTEEELAQHRHELKELVEARTKELQRINDQLMREIADRMRTETDLERVAAERAERVKELDCLFGISDLAGRRDVSLDEILQGTAELIPAAWQHPEATVARIVLDDAEFKTERFQETHLRMASDLVVGGSPAGSVEVFVLAESASELSAPFVPEDQRLLDVIAERLGRIVERLQSENALRRRVEELAGLNRIAHTVATETGLPAALRPISQMVTDLFAARYTHFIWKRGVDAEGYIQVEYEPESGPAGPTPLDVSLSGLPVVGRVLREARSQIIPDARSEPLAGQVREFLVQRDVQSIMLVPLVVRASAVGFLMVADDTLGRVFTADDVRLAETIATDVAAAIENARLSEQAQAAAVAEERSRLARELHDSVTQILFSINLIALSLGRLWRRNPELAERSTNELQRLTRGALAEMRTLLRELRPQTIAATELSILLKQLGDGVSARHDVPVEVEVDTPCEIPPEVHVALYRIAQEALSNITKHAEASQVAIGLACGDTAVQLTITDDGQGFDPDDVPAEHMGLAIMRERAEAIGATVVIDSQPGAGTSIAVTWLALETGGDTHAEI
jgi:signal transduction histidine kinase